MLRRRRRAEAEPGTTVPTRILVVAHDPDAGELLYRLLVRAGHPTELTAGAAGVVNRVGMGDIGCVVLDLGATDSGTHLRLLEAIRSHADPLVAHMRIVLVATHDYNRVFSWQAGVDAFLVRPFHADDFLREVVETMARSDEDRPRHRRQQLTEAAGGAV